MLVDNALSRWKELLQDSAHPTDYTDDGNDSGSLTMDILQIWGQQAIAKMTSVNAKELLAIYSRMEGVILKIERCRRVN